MCVAINADSKIKYYELDSRSSILAGYCDFVFTTSSMTMRITKPCASGTGFKSTQDCLSIGYFNTRSVGTATHSSTFKIPATAHVLVLNSQIYADKLCVNLHKWERWRANNLATDTQLQFHVTVRDCLQDDLQNFGVTGPRSVNAAVRSPSEDGNINTTGFDHSICLLCYTSMAKTALLKIKRLVFV